ncbi:MAG: hypothetical protein NT080_06185 [Spirochaetes bacterium]|nr:hypothetical protein [Spirochaetota bacterium]
MHLQQDEDLPAVVGRYTWDSNVFCVMVRSRDASPDFFTDLNQSIYDEIGYRPDTLSFRVWR